MSSILPEGAQRVQQFLSREASLLQVQLLRESTATAREAAEALGVAVHEIGKSIVFGSGENIIVAIVAGDQRVDADALASVLKIDRPSKLKPDSIKSRLGYVIGGVSPFDLPIDVKIIIDSYLYSLPMCFVAAGHPRAVVRTSGPQLVELTHAVVRSIAESAHE